MTLSPNILTTDVDALSPVDEYLMGAIRSNLLNVDSALSTGALSPVIQFKLNGPLDMLPGGKAKRVDAAFISSDQGIATVRVYLDKAGTSGTLDVDLRKITAPKISINSITPQFSASTLTVARAGSALNTQSISRTTSQLATQSVTFFRNAAAINSVVLLGGGIAQYNLNQAPDYGWEVGDTVTITGSTNAGNNGSFTILRVNDYNSTSVTLTNASAVAEVSNSGVCQLRAYSYNFANPVSSQFAAGEQVSLASHTDAGNNGTKTIYAVNLGGNNIVVKNPSGSAQLNTAGTADVLRFSYNLASPAPSGDFVVGDTLLAASHTSGGNNGNFTITAVNNGGSNVQVYNASGVVQGSVAGTISSNQWVYSFSSDPSTGVSVGDQVVMAGHSSSANNGNFSIRQVKRGALNNICVFNASGAAQGSAAGSVTHTRAVLGISQDVASDGSITTASIVELAGTSSATLNCVEDITTLGFQVVEINRGGGANKNIVIQTYSAAPSQSGAAGWVALQSRSIFSTRPTITIAPASTRTLGEWYGAYIENGYSFSNATLSSGEMLALYIFSTPVGADSVAVQVR